MDITGKLFVSKGQYGFYTTIKDKKTDAKVYLNVGFKRGEEPEDGCSINLINSFLTVSQSKSGEAKLKLFVMDYSLNGGTQTAPSGKPYPQSVKLEESNDESSLPF